MALKMLYRGPSSRLETLIEKIQQNKEVNQDIFSSHTSSSFSPSLSDDIGTPNSIVNESDLNQKAETDLNQEKNKEKCENGKNVEKTKQDGGRNGEGSYHCQFCDKTFPRLGYLKKHEQSHAEHMPFKCDYCARLFKHKRSRDRHTKLHTGDRRYKCPHCEAAFSRSDHLKIHMKTHDNQKPFQCTVCNRGYNTAAALTSHMQNHKKQAALMGSPNLNYSPRSTGSGGSSNCSSIQKRKETTVNSVDYMNLIKPTNGSRISCFYCTKSDFQSIEQLNSHIQSMHGGIVRGSETPTPIPSPNHQLTCEFCTMKFLSIQQLFHHLKTNHMDRINSPNSYLEHFNRNLMATYEMTGYGSNFRKMEEFYQQNSLDNKRKIEEEKEEEKSPVIKQEEEQEIPTDLSQPKPKKICKEETNNNNPSPNSTGTFLCNQCNAALPDFETFRTHLKTHLDQGSGNFMCQQCGVAFSDQQIYEQHIFSHFLITNSEYCCSHNCNKAFSKQEEYQKHLTEVHAQTLFKCDICTEVFDTKVAIQVHFAVAHSNEVKLFRCSACMEVFRSEREFRHHVKTRHIVSGAVQCIFCRAVCSSELEMHFHLAAHARQFRCPICPESFHVEFLLDRHLQTHHSQKEISYHQKAIATPTVNNNNNIEYQHPATKTSPFGFSGNKYYNPLQIDTLGAKHPNLLHGLYDSINKTQRFPDKNFLSPNKGLLGIYNHTEMIAKLNNFYSPENGVGERYYSPSSKPIYDSVNLTRFPVHHESGKPHSFHEDAAQKSQRFLGEKGYSCGICERSDFSTETEVHIHRKIVHNLKTGVSLRCAYCNGDFRSRSELENHMKISHNTSGKHKCLICDEIFPSPAVLAEHKLTHCKVGPSGKCSHCLIGLRDVTFFKSHLAEHNGQEIPVQCICCRQTLNSEFEIGLHAKFHTKSSDNKENTCALCLETLPSTAETRICENCFKKHNFSQNAQPTYHKNPQPKEIESQCNLCKKVYPSALKLQEHLIEHTFAGCEDRGYICYICSSVFTVSSGLQSHILEHGPNARPYDCNLCPAKFFFRAELDHHAIEHENSGAKVEESKCEVKLEKDEIKVEEEEEYIEVENLEANEKSSKDDVENKEALSPKRVD